VTPQFAGFRGLGGVGAASIDPQVLLSLVDAGVAATSTVAAARRQRVAEASAAREAAAQRAHELALAREQAAIAAARARAAAWQSRSAPGPAASPRSPWLLAGLSFAAVVGVGALALFARHRS
jgi:hypothetical protein